MPSDPRKDALRRGVLERRAALDAVIRAREDAARSQVLLRESAGIEAIAAYASRATEPSTEAVLDAWWMRGATVLLPLLRREPDWARYDGPGSLEPGWAGIPEPQGQALGAHALLGVELVVVPCLLVDRRGVRLGTGGGWYDRALVGRRPGTQVWALARESEVVDELPREPHDVHVDAVVTEAGFLRFT